MKAPYPKVPVSLHFTLQYFLLMEIEEIASAIRSLISNDKLEEALDYLEKVCDESGFDNNIESIKGWLKNLEERKNHRTIDDNFYIIERNKIRVSIREIAKEIESVYIRKEAGLNKEEFDPSFLSCFSGIIKVFFLIAFGYFLYLFITLPDLIGKGKESNVEYNSDSTFVIRQFPGNDKNGKSAEYIIYLVRGYNWSLGEVSKTEKHSVKINICSHIESLGVTNRINNDQLKSIICFGNASYEENLDIPKEIRLKIEEDRALARAKTLADCISPVLQKLTPVYLLNLGKNTKKAEPSEYQRQIIVVGLLKNELGVIHEEALFNGLRNEFLKGNLEFDILNYSKVIEVDSLELVKYL